MKANINDKELRIEDLIDDESLDWCPLCGSKLQ